MRLVGDEGIITVNSDNLDNKNDNNNDNLETEEDDTNDGAAGNTSKDIVINVSPEIHRPTVVLIISQVMT